LISLSLTLSLSLWDSLSLALQGPALHVAPLSPADVCPGLLEASGCVSGQSGALSVWQHDASCAFSDTVLVSGRVALSAASLPHLLGSAAQESAGVLLGLNACPVALSCRFVSSALFVNTAISSTSSNLGSADPREQRMLALLSAQSKLASQSASPSAGAAGGSAGAESARAGSAAYYLELAAVALPADAGRGQMRRRPLGVAAVRRARRQGRVRSLASVPIPPLIPDAISPGSGRGSGGGGGAGAWPMVRLPVDPLLLSPGEELVVLVKQFLHADPGDEPADPPIADYFKADPSISDSGAETKAAAGSSEALSADVNEGGSRAERRAAEAEAVRAVRGRPRVRVARRVDRSALRCCGRTSTPANDVDRCGPSRRARWPHFCRQPSMFGACRSPTPPTASWRLI
jgi:hypothetical protein